MWVISLPLHISDIQIEGANNGEGENCASILSMGVCGAEPKDSGGDDDDCEELPLVTCVGESEDPDGDIELKRKDAGGDENDCEELGQGVCGVETKDAGGDDNDCEEKPLVICAAEFEDPDGDIKFESGDNGEGVNSGGLPSLGVC